MASIGDVLLSCVDGAEIPISGHVYVHIYHLCSLKRRERWLRSFNTHKLHTEISDSSDMTQRYTELRHLREPPVNTLRTALI